MGQSCKATNRERNLSMLWEIRMHGMKMLKKCPKCGCRDIKYRSEVSRIDDRTIDGRTTKTTKTIKTLNVVFVCGYGYARSDAIHNGRRALWGACKREPSYIQRERRKIKYFEEVLAAVLGVSGPTRLRGAVVKTVEQMARHAGISFLRRRGRDQQKEMSR